MIRQSQIQSAAPGGPLNRNNAWRRSSGYARAARISEYCARQHLWVCLILAFHPKLGNATEYIFALPIAPANQSNFKFDTPYAIALYPR